MTEDKNDRRGNRRARPLGPDASRDGLCDETALFGTPDDIARKLEALHAGGVEYVLINFGGSRDNIRRFAGDVMPAFADPARLAAAK
jgi:alkanesulfonate monooxygenase SsuD/methylene tetrahydromethanopterin reductase-like flavin-dependent oxidoreductase (luciferase family)